MKDSSKDSSLTPFSRLRIDKLNRLSELFAKIMNEMHGMEHSERFWKIILLPYYSAVISSNEVILNNKVMSCNPPLEVYSNTVFQTNNPGDMVFCVIRSRWYFRLF